MLFADLGSVRIVKNCDLGLENVQDLGHSFSLYGPTLSWQITYFCSQGSDQRMAYPFRRPTFDFCRIIHKVAENIFVLAIHSLSWLLTSHFQIRTFTIEQLNLL